MTETELERARAALGAAALRTLYGECQAHGGCARWRFVKVYGSAARHLHCPHCLTRYRGREAVDPPSTP